METQNAAAELPLPDGPSQAHSQRVRDAVCASIEAEGPLSLGDYMQFVLYAPGYGYYMAGNAKIGAAGDFVTAPALSPLFGACLAQQSRAVLELTGGDILEFGAGTGELAVSLLSALAQSDVLPERYLILEPSAELVVRQQALLAAKLPLNLRQRVCWVETLPAGFNGVVIANEVLDAMPVEQFVIGTEPSLTGQVYIGLEQGELCRQVRPAAPLISTEVARVQASLTTPMPPGYCSEINLLAAPWLRALSDSVTRGLVLIIDYGAPEKEYYLPERNQGTLRSYFRHHVHEDVLRFPGLQDITADVDFTRVARAAVDSGFDLHGFTPQAHFLLGNGLAEHAATIETGTDVERYTLAQEVNTLSSSAAMGERFQVMGLSKSLDADLQGFIQVDFSHRL